MCVCFSVLNPSITITLMYPVGVLKLLSHQGQLILQLPTPTLVVAHLLLLLLKVVAQTLHVLSHLFNLDPLLLDLVITHVNLEHPLTLLSSQLLQLLHHLLHLFVLPRLLILPVVHQACPIR